MMDEKEQMFWINWTPDCLGKQDYDGELVSISTRYWPAGGSALVFNSETPELGIQKLSDPRIKPSAYSCIYLGNNCGNPIIEKKFTGETEKEVKDLVETWVREQYKKICELLIKGFNHG